MLVLKQSFGSSMAETVKNIDLKKSAILERFKEVSVITVSPPHPRTRGPWRIQGS